MVVIRAVHKYSSSLSFLTNGGLYFSTHLKESPCDLLWAMMRVEALKYRMLCHLIFFPVMATSDVPAGACFVGPGPGMKMTVVWNRASGLL